MILELILLGFVLSLSVFALFLSLSFIFGPPYLPTPKNAVSEMLDLAMLDKDDVVLDLGSGDGIVLIESAKRGATAIGFEINPFLVAFTILKARIMGVGNKVLAHIKPYQQANLADATVIFCYNMPKFMPALENKINKEAKKNVKIISYKFPLQSLKLVRSTKSGIHIYSKREF
jgi:SAM-dependent methyltransferase